MPLSKEGLKKNATPKDIFQFKDGDNIVRILPPTSRYFKDDIDFFAYKFLVHYNLGPEGSPPITCPRTKDKAARCPICETARRLRRNPATKDLASELNCRTRYLMNIIDVEHPDRGIQVAEVGPTVHDPIFDVAVDRDYGDVLDLLVGRNFKITFTPSNRSKTGYNSYSVLAGANPSSIKDALPKGWKDKIDELAGRVKEPPTYEELLSLVNAATGGQGVEDDGGTPPTHARTSKTNRAPAKEDFVDPGKQSDTVVKEGSSGSPTDDVGESTTEEPKTDAPAGDDGPPAAVEGRPDGAPDCWSTDFQPSAEKCKACGHNESCMEKFLEG